MWVLISVVIIVLSALLDFYLSLRQRKTIKNATKPPEIFKDQFTDEEFQKAKNYSLDKMNFGLVMDVIELAVSIIEIFIMSAFWKLTAISENEIIHSLVFLLAAALISTILDLPGSYYSQFVIEEKYGFNNSTVKLWITDTIKDFIISSIIMSIVVPIFIFIFNKSGPRFVIYTQIFMIIFVLILNVLAPILIIPLFNKLTPITEGPIYEAIISLCQKTKFNGKQVFEIDSSKRSSHTNAMVFGLFTKKIAIADTMLQSSTPEKISAVIAHEVGHSKHHHIWKEFAISQVKTSILLSSVYLIMTHDAPFIDFGFDDKPLIIGLVITGLVAVPFATIIQLPMNMLSRWFERQADTYAAKLNLPLDEALIDLAKDNKVAIEPDPLYSAFSHSHPTIVERVTYVREILQSKAKKD